MGRKFLLNIVFLLSINLLIKPFYVLVIDVSVQNAVGPVDYGIFFSLFNFCYLFQFIADLGIQNFNSKTIAQKSEKVGFYFAHIIGVKLILSLVFLTIVTLVAYLLNYPQNYFALLFYITFNQILLSFILYLRTNFAALGHYWLDSILSVVDKIIVIFMMSYLLWIYPLGQVFKIEWFIYAQSISLFITLLICFLISARKSIVQPLRFSLNFSRKLLKSSWPYASVILLMSAYTRMDGVMIERLLTDGKLEAGIYAAAYRLLDASNMVGYLFAGLLLPMFSALIGQRLNVQSLVSVSFRLIFILALTMSLFCYFYQYDIMTFMYPEYADAYYAQIMGVLMISFVSVSVSYIFGTLLTANGNIGQMNRVFIIGIAVNFILNLIYIPIFKASGAAYTTLITQIIVMVGQVFLAFRIFRFRIHSYDLIRLMVFTILALLIFWTLNGLVAIHWVFHLFVGFFCIILVSLLTRFIDIKQIELTLKNKGEAIDFTQ